MLFERPQKGYKSYLEENKRLTSINNIITIINWDNLIKTMTSQIDGHN